KVLELSQQRLGKSIHSFRMIEKCDFETAAEMRFYVKLLINVHSKSFKNFIVLKIRFYYQIGSIIPHEKRQPREIATAFIFLYFNLLFPFVNRFSFFQE